jgi:cell wall-associated NlpC family hydrolase
VTSSYPRAVSSRRGTKLALTFAIALLTCLTATQAAAEEAVPWGAGCMPTPTGTTRTSGNCGAELDQGEAVAPPGAPDAVKRMISAANEIDNRPYLWGGGHASFLSRGYDCSGAISYVLHAAGLLEQTMVSGQLASWGQEGVGRWITVYANSQHVFIAIAGLRFDTRGDPPGVTGPRWHRARVDGKHFTTRHPSGL